MPLASQPNNNDALRPNPPVILQYEGEDDQSFFVSGLNTKRLAVPKNRSIPRPFRDQPPQPLTPAFHLLVLAFVGLAPAGLGTLVLAPLAALWALAVVITRPLTRADHIRIIIILGIAALLFGIAIPLSAQVLTHINVDGRFP